MRAQSCSSWTNESTAWKYLPQGLGPLTTSLEMIRAAQMISQAGSQLDKLARAVAEQCGEERTRQDLLAYLQRIALYCHQLNICSKVC